MAKKDNTTKTLLLLGAGALAAYLVIPKVKEAVSDMVPGMPSFDFGGLLPEGGIDFSGLAAGLAAGVNEAIREGLSGITFSPWGEDGPPWGPAPDLVIDPEPEIPGTVSTWDYIKQEAVTVAKYAGIVAATGITIRYAGPPTARALGTTASRLAGRLFQTQAAQTTARATTTAGEGLGPASATKLPGQKLKYPRGLGPLSSAVFAMALPDLLTETIALFTGKETRHYGDPGWDVHKTWLGQMGPAFGVHDPNYLSAGPLPSVPDSGVNPQFVNFVAENRGGYSSENPYFHGPTTGGGGGGGGGVCGGGGGGGGKSETDVRTGGGCSGFSESEREWRAAEGGYQGW